MFSVLLLADENYHTDCPPVTRPFGEGHMVPVGLIKPLDSRQAGGSRSKRGYPDHRVLAQSVLDFADDGQVRHCRSAACTRLQSNVRKLLEVLNAFYWGTTVVTTRLRKHLGWY